MKRRFDSSFAGIEFGPGIHRWPRNRPTLSRQIYYRRRGLPAIQDNFLSTFQQQAYKLGDERRLRDTGSLAQNITQFLAGLHLCARALFRFAELRISLDNSAHESLTGVERGFIGVNMLEYHLSFRQLAADVFTCAPQHDSGFPKV